MINFLVEVACKRGKAWSNWQPPQSINLDAKVKPKALALYLSTASDPLDAGHSRELMVLMVLIGRMCRHLLHCRVQRKRKNLEV